ncbi:MAG: AraC family transcriptional regulator [Marinagarivorans sp.]|nr:AraC family transcriptional regulator [Marinagarivorans sp.]
MARLAVFTLLMSCQSLSVLAQETAAQSLPGASSPFSAQASGQTIAPAVLRQEDQSQFVKRAENSTPLSAQVEELKKAALELNRDLLVLEEDLLFPANTQIAVYVSVDIGKYFQLDGIRLMVDGEMVASHLYTEKQNSALTRGGVQRLYVGNLKTGEHEITAVFHGYGPESREYKRGASYRLNKNQKSTMLEIKVQDAETNMQPTFTFKEWQL